MLDARQDLPLGRPVAGERIGDRHARHVGKALQQSAEEFSGRRLVPAALHQDIEHIPVLVDGAPEGVLHPVDTDEYLVAVPLVAGARAMTAQRIRVGLAELPGPLPDRLVGHEHAALGQQCRHVALAQGKAAVQPHGVGDDLGGETVTGVRGRGDFIFHSARIARSPCLGPS